MIRAPLPGVLVVQGGPGTGKTAVALHRTAFLLYANRERNARPGGLPVGPTRGVLAYIRQVLPRPRRREPGGGWVLGRRAAKATVQEWLAREWPAGFAAAWSARYAPPRPLPQTRTSELEQLARLVHEWPIRPAGTEGYPKAEVTVGGIATSELSSKTMEARKVPGLYFIGEVVDVTGWLGGYNFQWAWASGHAAGEVA